jgi:hypothetical protein
LLIALGGVVVAIVAVWLMAKIDTASYEAKEFRSGR